MKNLSIYVHWPFCKSKCPYCDFNSHVSEKIDLSSWNKAYIQQIENNKDYLKDKKIVSVFFGGGTPSLMPDYIVGNILEYLSKFAAIDDNVEITLEANPTSVEANKFKSFAKAGINRVSLGIQSLDDEELKFLGREHSAAEAIKAIELARENFNRYSFDLIYALPNQTLNAWENILAKALKLAGNHLSLYQLTIEKGTEFYSLNKNKKFIMPKEELARKFYLLTQNIMQHYGLPAYEVSNHAKPGEECRHNMVYWQYGDFLGIGPGAHSRINKQALNAVYNPNEWLAKALANKNVNQNQLSLTEDEVFNEALLMGLRLTRGVDEERFKEVTGKDFSHLNQKKLKQLIEDEYIIKDGSRLKTSLKGRLLLNHLIELLTAI